MQCQDTGSLEVIHIPRETVLLARDIQNALDAIQASGHGDGQITLKVQHGKIPFIDWTLRTFRKLAKQ